MIADEMTYYHLISTGTFMMIGPLMESFKRLSNFSRRLSRNESRTCLHANDEGIKYLGKYRSWSGGSLLTILKSITRWFQILNNIITTSVSYEHIMNELRIPITITYIGEHELFNDWLDS